MLVFVFGLWINAANITMMRDDLGHCFIWQGGFEANIIIQNHSCQEVMGVIQDQARGVSPAETAKGDRP